MHFGIVDVIQPHAHPVHDPQAQAAELAVAAG